MIRRHLREVAVAGVYLLLLAVLAVFAPGFFQGDKFRSILVSSAPVLTVAVGMTLVILARHIDISVGAQFSLCGIVAGLLTQAGVPMPLVALGTIATGAAYGAVNGALVAGLRLPSIVVTLATLGIGREALRWWREGEFVRNLSDRFQWFGAGQSAGQWIVIGIAVAVCGAFAWGLRHLAMGRAVFATGSDAEAARLAGIRPQRVVFSVFTLLGALAGLGALLNGVRFVDIDPNAGMGMEMLVIAAVVVGGTAISGGRGTLAGTLAGVVLLGTIGPALVFLHIQPHWEKALQGAIILLAVASDALERRRS